MTSLPEAGITFQMSGRRPQTGNDQNLYSTSVTTLVLIRKYLERENIRQPSDFRGHDLDLAATKIHEEMMQNGYRGDRDKDNIRNYIKNNRVKLCQTPSSSESVADQAREDNQMDIDELELPAAISVDEVNVLLT